MFSHFLHCIFRTKLYALCLIMLCSLILPFLLTSCYAELKAVRNGTLRMHPNTVKLLEGTYSNYPLADTLNPLSADDTSRRARTFFEDIKPFKYSEITDWSGTSFGIRIKDEKHITFILLKGSDTLAVKNLHYYIGAGCLIVNNNWRLWGIPPILWRYDRCHLVLTKSENGNLIVDKESTGSGALLIIFAGGGERFWSYYYRSMQ